MIERTLGRLRPRSLMEVIALGFAFVIGSFFMLLVSIEGSIWGAFLVVAAFALMTVVQWSRSGSQTVIERVGFLIGSVLTGLVLVGATIGRVIAWILR